MMMKICQLLVSMILAIVSQLGFSSIDLPTSFQDIQLDSFLVDTLRDISKGPLEGKSIILLLGEEDMDEEGHHFLIFLLKNLGIPLTLIQVPEDRVVRNEGEDIQNIVARNRLNGKGVEPTEILPLGDILLCITNRKPGKFLMEPLQFLGFANLLIISRSAYCDIQSHLQNPFTLRMKSVALLCPVIEKQYPVGVQSVAYRVYSWQPFQPLQKIVDLGLWSPSSFLSWNDLFIDRFPSFGGQTLHVASDKGDMPFLLQGIDEEYIGMNKNLMDTLGASLNFSYTLTARAGDGRWGMKDNGVWVGMFRDLVQGGKNLTINSFSITWERGTDFEFSVPYFTTGFGFSVLKPPLLPRWMNLTYTFTMEVWLATAVSLILASFELYLLSRGRKYQLSLFNCSLVATQGLVKQTLRRIPESWLMRVFLALWWLGTYVIIVSYSCNLIAMLTVPLYPPKLHTVEELAESDYRYCMVDFGTAVPQALAKSSDASLFALGSRIDLVSRTDQGEYGETGCIDLVLSGDYAQIEFFPYMQLVYSMSGWVNKIYYPRETVYKSSLAFFFPKGTPWVYKFSSGIQHLVEAHLIQKWHSDILRQLSRYTIEEEDKSSREALKLAHLQGPFIVYTLGILVSNAAFLVEFLGHTFKK